MCFGLNILGSIFGSGDGGAKKRAEEQARNDREIARGAQLALEATKKQQKAAEDAAALLSRPTETVDVQVGEIAPEQTTDPGTGRRRTPRSSFQINNPQSGLRI